ncbi:MAG: AsmA family protein, partial [Nitrospirae bacterium]|nr:AsmA family protein [Nitrospirota bacterium]
MGRVTRVILVLLAGFAVLAIAAGVLIAARFDSASVRQRVEEGLTSALDAPVRVGDAGISLCPPGFQARSIEVGSPGGSGAKGPFLTLKSLRFGVHLLPLLKGEVRVGRVVLEDPRVSLAPARQGGWNLPSGAPSGGSQARGGAGAFLVGALLVERVDITGGVVESQGVAVLRDIRASIADVSAVSVVGLSAEARSGKKGDVSLDGRVGPLVRETRTVPVPFEAGLRAKDVDALPLFRAFSSGGFGIDAPVSLESKWRADEKHTGSFSERIEGEGNIRVGSGRLVGAEKWETIVQAVKMAVRAADAARPVGAVDEIAADFRMSGGVLSISPLRYQGAGLVVTGAGTYDLRRERLDFRLKGESGGRAIRFAVTGPAN